MQTSTTLADTRSQLGWLVTDSSDFLQNLNQMRAYVIESGLWEGSIVETIFNGSTTGYLTLPAHMASILGVSINKYPVPVFGQFQQYIECGPGTINNTKPTVGFLTFMGDQFVSNVDHIVGQQLRIRIANSGDAGVVVRISGTDTSGNELDDATGNEGQNLTLLNPVTTLATSLNTFTGFQKTVTLGAISVYSWDGTTETLLSRYLPSETRPHYSRYLSGTIDTTFPVACLCKLRYYPVLADTDWVVPGNINAIEFGMQAVDAQHVRSYDMSSASWNNCFRILNEEHRSLRGKAQPSLTFLGPMSNRTRIKCD